VGVASSMEVFWSFGPRLVLRGKGELVVLCDDGRCVDGIYVGAFCAAEAFSLAWAFSAGSLVAGFPGVA
jgi:hypothetical protein